MQSWPMRAFLRMWTPSHTRVFPPRVTPSSTSAVGWIQAGRASLIPAPRCGASDSSRRTGTPVSTNCTDASESSGVMTGLSLPLITSMKFECWLANDLFLSYPLPNGIHFDDPSWQ
jgi:hypothetical protein